MDSRGVPSEAWEDPSGGMESRWEEEEWIGRLVKKPSWYVREVKSTWLAVVRVGI